MLGPQSPYQVFRFDGAVHAVRALEVDRANDLPGYVLKSDLISHFRVEPTHFSCNGRSLTFARDSDLERLIPERIVCRPEQTIEITAWLDITDPSLLLVSQPTGVIEPASLLLLRAQSQSQRQQQLQLQQQSEIQQQQHQQQHQQQEPLAAPVAIPESEIGRVKEQVEYSQDIQISARMVDFFTLPRTTVTNPLLYDTSGDSGRIEELQPEDFSGRIEEVQPEEQQQQHGSSSSSSLGQQQRIESEPLFPPLHNVVVSASTPPPSNGSTPFQSAELENVVPIGVVAGSAVVVSTVGATGDSVAVVVPPPSQQEPLAVPLPPRAYSEHSGRMEEWANMFTFSEQQQQQDGHNIYVPPPLLPPGPSIIPQSAVINPAVVFPIITPSTQRALPIPPPSSSLSSLPTPLPPTSPSTSSPSSTLPSRLVLEMLRHHRQEFERTNLILEKGKSILANRLEVYQSKQPTMFIVLPDLMTTTTTTTTRVMMNPLQFRLYYLCECGRDDWNQQQYRLRQPFQPYCHIVTSTTTSQQGGRGGGAGGGYLIERPDQFFKEFGPYLYIMLQLMRFGIPVGGCYFEPLDHGPVTGTTGTGMEPNKNEMIQQIEKMINYLDTLRTTTDQADDMDSLTTFLRHAEQTNLQNVTNFIELSSCSSSSSISSHSTLDSDIVTMDNYSTTTTNTTTLSTDQQSQFYRTQTFDGYAKWLCFPHYQTMTTFNLPPILQTLSQQSTLNHGYFNHRLGAIKACPRSPNEALGLYTSTSRYTGLQSLDLILDWEYPERIDLVALKEVVLYSNLSILSICFRKGLATLQQSQQKERGIDHGGAGSRFVPILELLNFPSLRVLTITGAIGMWKLLKSLKGNNHGGSYYLNSFEMDHGSEFLNLRILSIQASLFNHPQHRSQQQPQPQQLQEGRDDNELEQLEWLLSKAKNLTKLKLIAENVEIAVKIFNTILRSRNPGPTADTGTRGGGGGGGRGRRGHVEMKVVLFGTVGTSHAWMQLTLPSTSSDTHSTSTRTVSLPTTTTTRSDYTDFNDLIRDYGAGLQSLSIGSIGTNLATALAESTASIITTPLTTTIGTITGSTTTTTTTTNLKELDIRGHVFKPLGRIRMIQILTKTCLTQLLCSISDLQDVKIMESIRWQEMKYLHLQCNIADPFILLRAMVNGMERDLKIMMGGSGQPTTTATTTNRHHQGQGNHPQKARLYLDTFKYEHVNKSSTFTPSTTLSATFTTITTSTSAPTQLPLISPPRLEPRGLDLLLSTISVKSLTLYPKFDAEIWLELIPLIDFTCLRLLRLHTVGMSTMDVDDLLDLIPVTDGNGKRVPLEKLVLWGARLAKEQVGRMLARGIVLERK